jgi:hypothetical protein
MNIEKTAQLNWFRGIRDRIRGNKPDESGQELSFNEQELRGLEEIERRKTEEERKRVDKLVQESKERAESFGRPDNIPGKFELSRSSIQNILSMDRDTLWHKLCASFENCSPYVSETTAQRGRIIRYLVDTRQGDYRGGWGSVLRSIDFLLQGLELDIRNAGNNSKAAISHNNMQEIFTNRDWLMANKDGIQRAYAQASPDSINKEVLNKFLTNKQSYYARRDAAIEVWASFLKNKYQYYYGNTLSDQYFYNIHLYADRLWEDFKLYFRLMSGNLFHNIGIQLGKKYLPEDMQSISDGVHAIDVSMFDIAKPANLMQSRSNARGENDIFYNWTVNKWKEFVEDTHLMLSVFGFNLKGVSNINNINGENLYYNMMQKIIMIENIVNRDPFISHIFNNSRLDLGDSYYIYAQIKDKMSADHNPNREEYLVSILNQIYVNQHGGYSRAISEASDESLRSAADRVPFAVEHILLHLEFGENMYNVINNFDQYQSALNSYREKQHSALKKVRNVLANPDLTQMSPEEARQYFVEKLNRLANREFEGSNIEKAKQEQILDSPFEHTSVIRPSTFPGQAAFNSNSLPELQGTPISFNIAIYPKKKENDPENFAQVLAPGGHAQDGLNFHHQNIPSLENKKYYSHILGWIGGWVDVVGSNMYIAEIQSDVMQHTSYMKDPEKSKTKLNEELKKQMQELQKEKDNLAKQSTEGIEKFYDKRIEELEKKRDSANNEAMKQQMDTAIKKLTEQKNAKEDPWVKLRKKIKDIENVIVEIKNQIQELIDYERNTNDQWRKRPQFADVKSKIENRFSEYVDVFYNEAIYYCAQLKIKGLWIVHSDLLAAVWRHFATADTVEMYKKIYDKRAMEMGAEKKGNWWHLDLTKKMPKYASTNWYQRTKNGMV